LTSLLRTLIDIALLRRTPESLPGTTAALVLAVLLYAVVSAVFSLSFGPTMRTWPLQLLIDIALTLGWYRAATMLAEKSERFAQTAIAIFGVMTVFTPLVLPLNAYLLGLGKGDPMLLPATFAMFAAYGRLFPPLHWCWRK
jgi:hypothetical protein